MPTNTEGDLNRAGAHLALGVDHVGVMLELVAQVVINIAVEEATLATLFSPQKVILEKIGALRYIFGSHNLYMSPNIHFAVRFSLKFIT